MNWIKVQTNLRTSPKIVRISSALEWTPVQTLGAVINSWMIADEHATETGLLEGLSFSDLDWMIGSIGLSQAMANVGWLKETSKGVQFINYEEHNGSTAKSRAREQKRKQLSRKCPPKSGQKADSKRTREEKRREDKNKHTQSISSKRKNAQTPDVCGDGVDEFKDPPIHRPDVSHDERHDLRVHQYDETHDQPLHQAHDRRDETADEPLDQADDHRDETHDQRPDQRDHGADERYDRRHDHRHHLGDESIDGPKNRQIGPFLPKSWADELDDPTDDAPDDVSDERVDLRIDRRDESDDQAFDRRDDLPDERVDERIDRGDERADERVDEPFHRRDERNDVSDDRRDERVDVPVDGQLIANFVNKTAEKLANAYNSRPEWISTEAKRQFYLQQKSMNFTDEDVDAAISYITKHRQGKLGQNEPKIAQEAQSAMTNITKLIQRGVAYKAKIRPKKKKESSVYIPPKAEEPTEEERAANLAMIKKLTNNITGK